MRPGAGETFRALNGQDDRRPGRLRHRRRGRRVQSLAGVTARPQAATRNQASVFLECAPVRSGDRGSDRTPSCGGIRARVRARHRSGLCHAAEAATRMILDLCGGEASTVVSAGSESAPQRSAIFV
jgi:phenylalanyl-tRNA synthetase beta chain